jgi:hypothetical protein
MYAEKRMVTGMHAGGVGGLAAAAVLLRQKFDHVLLFDKDDLRTRVGSETVAEVS